LVQQSSQIFESLEAIDCIAIDDLDSIVTKRDWEESLFHLYNRCENTQLIFAATKAPNALDWVLPDLQSRLNLSLRFQVLPLSDQHLIDVLQSRATSRGMSLSDEVGHYLIHHVPRDLPHLMDCLNRLDQVSLAEQRRLTIPFVKQTLSLN